MEYAANYVNYDVDHFFVLYDAGETNGLMPVLKRFEEEGRKFRILVMGTAETIIKEGMFKEQRLVLKDLDVNTVVSNTEWQRESKLDIEDVKKICQVAAKTMIVGTASRVQRQVLKNFNGKKIAFCDNFDYDVTHESFKTVKKTQSKAEIVLCPSKNLVKLLSENSLAEKYHIVGKPSLEQWAKELEAINKAPVLETLGFKSEKGPIVTFVGGYGPGYEVINPLFDEAADFLRKKGYQVLIQPHPKVATQVVKTPEALAISEYVVGFNSSVIFDAAVIGKKGIYLFPENLKFDHFAIREGLLPKVSSKEELLKTIMESKEAVDLYEIEQIPRNSIEKVTEILNKALACNNLNNTDILVSAY